MSNDNVDEVVENIIKKYANVANLSDTEYLINILDSIDIVDVVLDLEDTLNIEINESSMRRIRDNMKVSEVKALCKKLKKNYENDK